MFYFLSPFLKSRFILFHFLSPFLPPTFSLFLTNNLSFYFIFLSPNFVVSIPPSLPPSFFLRRFSRKSPSSFVSAAAEVEKAAEEVAAEGEEKAAAAGRGAVGAGGKGGAQQEPKARKAPGLF